MKPVRIFRHIASEGPGYFATVLERRDIPLQLIRVDQGDAIPPGVDDCAGLVFMGGTMSVNDDLPWIAEALALIRRAAQAGVPVLGHCLGGQLISKALGGVVRANAVQEFGWHAVQRVDKPVAHDWLGQLPSEFDVFHWHGETFSLPQDATLLLTSAHCAHQAFVWRNMLALQCHVEMTADMVLDWAVHSDHEMAAPGTGVQSAQQMQQNLPSRVAALQCVADVLYERWLRCLVT
jgi:GMP synthase-like glutamine amidotransferase